MKKEQLTAVEQAAVALRLWSNAWREFDKTGKNKPESFEKVIKPFIQMEKEQTLEVSNLKRLELLIKLEEVTQQRDYYYELWKKNNTYTKQQEQ